MVRWRVSSSSSLLTSAFPHMNKIVLPNATNLNPLFEVNPRLVSPNSVVKVEPLPDPRTVL